MVNFLQLFILRNLLLISIFYGVFLHHKIKAMRIYTSYFGNYRKLAAANVKMICVALGKPRFYNAPQIIEVAPRRYMLDDKWTYEEYTNMYLNDVLAKVNPQELIQTIQRLSEGKDVALCCYEKPGDFCHRHILAKWLTEKTGIEITEFGVVERKEPKYEQASLFEI